MPVYRSIIKQYNWVRACECKWRRLCKIMDAHNVTHRCVTDRLGMGEVAHLWHLWSQIDVPQVDGQRTQVVEQLTEENTIPQCVDQLAHLGTLTGDPVLFRQDPALNEPRCTLPPQVHLGSKGGSVAPTACLCALSVLLCPVCLSLPGGCSASFSCTFNFLFPDRSYEQFVCLPTDLCLFLCTYRIICFCMWLLLHA